MNETKSEREFHSDWDAEVFLVAYRWLLTLLLDGGTSSNLP